MTALPLSNRDPPRGRCSPMPAPARFTHPRRLSDRNASSRALPAGLRVGIGGAGEQGGAVGCPRAQSRSNKSVSELATLAIGQEATPHPSPPVTVGHEISRGEPGRRRERPSMLAAESASRQRHCAMQSTRVGVSRPSAGCSAAGTGGQISALEIGHKKCGGVRRLRPRRTPEGVRCG